MGAPGDSGQHKRVVAAALSLLEKATDGGAIVELETPYRPAPANL
jgi:hypothetical protein